jgi:XTP/dITP diphosphohydrolase
VRERRGGNGFGYDPVFQPDGLELTAAELAPAEKDARSHRGQAFAALVPLVAELLRPA